MPTFKTVTRPAEAEAQSVAPAEFEFYRLSVEEYERMAEHGVLNDPRVELIDGLLVKKMTKKPPHVFVCDAVCQALRGLIPEGWWLREEKPIRLGDLDEPEPDVSIVRGGRGDYLDRHPGPAEVGLIVEVADSSLKLDRGRKLEAYGRGGIPVYWIINLVDRQIEVHLDPDQAAGGYGRRQVYGLEDRVPVLLDVRELGTLAVAEALPRG